MNILAGIDFDKNAIATYTKNFPEAHVFNVNIKELDIASIETILSPHKNEILVFAACAPCQPFSKQNRYKDSRDDRICY